jgi:PhnB protein
MFVNPYLSFPGNCREAFAFYAACLGGELGDMMTHEAMPPGMMELPEGWAAKIMHASLKVGGTVLMGSDAPPDHYKAPAGFHVSFVVESAEAADRAFAGLAEGGVVTMPIQATFWAVRFGMLVDRFGVPWMVNCEKGG